MTMKAALALVLVVLGVVASSEVVPDVTKSPVYDYHRRVGIPRAMEIKKLEEQQAAGQRIVGGNLIDISQTPYQVGLVMQVLVVFSTICGGSIISPTRIVSAAHCVSDGVTAPQSLTVVLGSNTIFSGGQRHNVPLNNFIQHPGWNLATVENDVAVIIMPTTITYSNVIQPIALPSGSHLNNDFVGWMALASGYGLTVSGGSVPSNQALSAVEVPVITNEDCKETFGDFVHASNICIDGSHGRSTCEGDSGGPLAARANNAPMLIGITSYGARAGCDKDFPAAFARVTSFINWIHSI